MKAIAWTICVIGLIGCTPAPAVKHVKTSDFLTPAVKPVVSKPAPPAPAVKPYIPVEYVEILARLEALEKTAAPNPEPKPQPVQPATAQPPVRYSQPQYEEPYYDYQPRRRGIFRRGR